MLTAYVDESGQEGRDHVIIAGYIGSDEAWDRMLSEWKKAIAPRQSLHMHDLRWRHPRTAKLIDRIRAIPDECGLQRVAGGVNVRDYADMFPAEIIKDRLAGYTVALFPLVVQILRWIPRNEKVKIIFEEQTVFAERREAVLTAISQNTCFRTEEGLSQLAGWEAKPKGSLFEACDALAYAALQYARDPKSPKAKLCSPLLGDRMIVGRFLSKRETREMLTLFKHLVASGWNPADLSFLVSEPLRAV